MLQVDEARISAFAPGLDLECLRDNISSFEKITNGDVLAGPIAKLDIASRFREAIFMDIIVKYKLRASPCSLPLW
jgi:hypothetical protein